MNGSVAPTPEIQALETAPAAKSLVPLASRELFWRARYLQESTALAHLPALFWLIGSLRPRRIVSLNIGQGVLYFGACHATDKTTLDTRCHGFGQWSSSGVPDALSTYNAEQYDEFSTIQEADAAEALRRFTDNSIDLLIVEPPLDRDIMQLVFDEWMTRMSERGVMLIAGLDTLTDEDAERLASVQMTHETVRFEHSGGLAMICCGQSVPSRVKRLKEIGSGGAEFMTVERIFARLGALHVNEWRAREATRQAQELVRIQRRLEDEIAALRADPSLQGQPSASVSPSPADIGYRDADLVTNASDAAGAGIDHPTHAELQQTARRQAARIEELQNALEIAEEAQESWQKKLADAQEALNDQISTLNIANGQEVAKRREAEAALSDARAGLIGQQARSLEDVAALTEVLAAAEERALRRVKDLKDHEDRIAQQEAQIAELHHALASLSIAHDALQAEKEQLSATVVQLKAQLAEADQALATQLAEKEQLSTSLTDLKAQLAEADQALAARSEAQDALLVEKEQLSIAVGQLKADLSRQSDDWAREAETFASINTQLNATRTELDATRTALASAESARDSANAQVAQLKTSLAKTEKALSSLKGVHAALMEDRGNLAKSRDELLQSTSWRVTEPLRQVSSIIRKPPK